ncbi:MAG: substrate-binding periplasmic protein [Pseudomonas sp.]
MTKWRFALALAALLTSQAGADEEIILASPSYWCPFSCTAGDRQEGFTVDIIRWIFARHAIPVRLVNENYSRALSDVRSGHYTASPSTLKDEAPDFIYPDEAISSNRFCFYTRADDSWHYSGASSLSGRSTGIIQGYSYGEELDAFIRDNGQAFQAHSGNDLTTRLLKQLLLKRFDTFVEEENLVDYTLRNQPRSGIRNAGCASGKLAYMAIAPRHPKAQEYARLFSAGMREMRRNGELARVLARYGLKDWQQ